MARLHWTPTPYRPDSSNVGVTGETHVPERLEGKIKESRSVSVDW